MGTQRERARRVRVVVIAAGIGAALLLSAAAAAAATPTLGLASVAPGGAGFGHVRPRTISFGGDPTSFVSGVKWRSWGGSRAVGVGRADWVWPGWCVACGSVELPATVVAFGLTTCGGHSAYSRVEWYFPSRGMSFDARLAEGSICGSSAPPTGAPRQANCGRVAVRSPGAPNAIASGISMYASPISCAAARRFVAGSGADRYLNRNARFTRQGWWCGSELSMDMGGPQRFSCVKGDFTNVSFVLRRG